MLNLNYVIPIISGATTGDDGNAKILRHLGFKGPFDKDPSIKLYTLHFECVQWLIQWGKSPSPKTR